MEQVVDELARAAGMDPVAFRRQNVTESANKAPLLAVLDTVTKAANWQPGSSSPKPSSGDVVSGRGIAWSNVDGTTRQAAAVADITVNKKTGKIVAKTLHVAGDAGLIVYPEGSENNEEGAAVQGLSRAITEEVTFNNKHVTSLDWVTYPMLRFKDAPKVFIHGLTRTDVPDPLGPGSRTTGSGEPALAPVAAAVANAFFDATGVRIYEAPMSPARVRAVLKAGKVA
jgi:CO/xanthine dehydrogenase Mo-binding subunit